VKIILILRDLRVYKLARIIFEAWKNKIQSVNSNNMVKEPEYNEYFEEGKKYLKKGNLEKAEEMFIKSLEINPNNWETYQYLGFIYARINDINGAEKMFMKSLEINERNDAVCAWLGFIYLNQHKLKDAEKLLERAIEINPKNEEAYTQLCSVYSAMNVSNEKIEKFLYDKKGILFKVDSYDSNITEYHYQQLYKKLNEDGIRYIAMQYPRVNIDTLKNMFKGDEDVIFVSNEENFNNALKEGSYDDYFIDKFSDEFDFGHCNPKGNKLIAENVANIILKELKIDYKTKI